MSERIKFLVIAVALLPLVCAGQYAIPQGPPTELSDMHSEFWVQPSNWPLSLTSGHLRYKRVISIGDKESSIVETVKDAERSGHSFSISYKIDGKHLLKGAIHKPKGEGDMDYGPFFGWYPSRNVRFKGFRYANGFHEIHYLATDGKIVKSWYTDYGSNAFTMVVYDSKSKIVGYANGPECPEKEPWRKSVYMIEGKRVNKFNEFAEFFKRYREVDLTIKKTHNQWPQRIR